MNFSFGSLFPFQHGISTSRHLNRFPKLSCRCTPSTFLCLTPDDINKHMQKGPRLIGFFRCPQPTFSFDNNKKKSVLHRFTFKIELEIHDSSFSLIGARALFISFFYSRLPYISFDLKMPEIFLFIFVNDDSCSLKKND